MQSLNQKVVAITGAGSGIGRGLALALASDGARLALSDINTANLAETASLCGLQDELIHQQALDVADRGAMEAWAAKVVEHFGAVHVIINNAGVALNVSVEHLEQTDFEWLMGINFWGVVHGTQVFLPYIKQQEWGHIVNISSLFGLMSVPNQSAYNAAKFAVRGFTESLQMEMRISQNNIGVSCVHPGGVATNIANASRHGEALGMEGTTVEERVSRGNELLARTTPDQAAQIIIRGIVENRPRVLVGWDARLLDWLVRLMPINYRKILIRQFKR